MNSHEHAYRPLMMIPGALAVSLLLFGTRWSSYIGYFPLLLTDVLILFAIGRLMLSRSHNQGRIGEARIGLTGWAVAVLFLYVAVRALMGSEALTEVWLRDAMPFLYAGLTFVGVAAYARTSAEGRNRTGTILWLALNGHLTWILLVNFGVLDPSLFPSLPSSDVRIFSQRPDVDMAVLGMTAGLYLRHFMLNRRRAFSALGLIFSLIAVSGLESRAGLMAALTALAISYIFTTLGHPQPREKLKWAVTAPLIFLLAIAIVPQTDAGGRLVATVGTSEISQQEELDAVGTANARNESWDRVIEWTNGETGRNLVGAGFGPNFIEASGAEQSLSGTAWQGVRSPHNWFVGIYARLGIVGLLLVFLVLVGLIYHLARIRIAVGSSDLLTLAAAGVFSLLVAATFGVILESPFGAVPFWWFLGVLLAERRVALSTTDSALVAFTSAKASATPGRSE